MNFIDTKCKVEGDKVSLTFDNTTIVLPPAKAKKLADAACNGKTAVMGIRPEDIGDSEIEIEGHPVSYTHLMWIRHTCRNFTLSVHVLQRWHYGDTKPILSVCLLEQKTNLE